MLYPRCFSPLMASATVSYTYMIASYEQNRLSGRRCAAARRSVDELMRLLHDPHYERTLYMPDIFHLSQFVHMKIVIGIHVLYRDLQHEIEFPRNDIAFRHFGQFIHRADESRPRPLVVLFQGYITDSQQPFPDLGMIQQGGILTDDPCLLQTPDPLMHRGRAKMYLRGDLANRDLGI